LHGRLEKYQEAFQSCVEIPHAPFRFDKAQSAVVLPGDRWEIIDIGLIESVEGTNEPAPAVENRDEERSVLPA
jgi:hypothetical protein